MNIESWKLLLHLKNSQLLIIKKMVMMLIIIITIFQQYLG